VEDGHSFLLFSLGGELFGLPALLVRSVLERDDVVPLPLSPSFVLGAANIQGRVVCIVDAAALFELEVVSRRSFWLVVDLPDGPVGLAVSSVRQSPPGVALERNPGPQQERPLPAVEYSARMEGEFFRVLSLRALYDFMMSRME
jgi:purine-binding chemotaxis protein CheW